MALPLSGVKYIYNKIAPAHRKYERILQWTFVCLCVLSCFSCVWFFATPWPVVHQVPLSKGFYWSGLPCPPPGDLPDPGIELVSPALQEETWPLSYQGRLNICISNTSIQHNILLYLFYHISLSSYPSIPGIFCRRFIVNCTHQYTSVINILACNS